ncbi:5970_t:CDS:1 [Ambispora gerdemannii]|uniref:5970_t:CDS:1 n=1 Tax=Ambispora gerdemannii TaxID=144530 RepID=A0A9N9A2S8_9GLOM|nr:5970_t:CDS:1 [Ambispora gerdemannii]
MFSFSKVTSFFDYSNINCSIKSFDNYWNRKTSNSDENRNDKVFATEVYPSVFLPSSQSSSIYGTIRIKSGLSSKSRKHLNERPHLVYISSDFNKYPSEENNEFNLPSNFIQKKILHQENSAIKRRSMILDTINEDLAHEGKDASKRNGGSQKLKARSYTNIYMLQKQHEELSRREETEEL